MVTVAVPRPGPHAFQKNRPLSDLLRAQVKHFQHLEEKLPVDLRGRFLPHQITTEAAAAQYIAHMTALLKDRGKAKPGRVQEMPRRKAVQPGRAVQIAAAVEEPVTSSKPSARSKKKTITRKRGGNKS
jgi:hypothetical protein